MRARLRRLLCLLGCHPQYGGWCLYQAVATNGPDPKRRFFIHWFECKACGGGRMWCETYESARARWERENPELVGEPGWGWD